MEIHHQKSTRVKGFWQPVFVSEVLQATTFYFRDLEIVIPQTNLSGMGEGDRIYVENNADPLHLIRGGSSVPYIPLSGEVTSSPGPVVWKQGGEIHYIYHEEE